MNEKLLERGKYKRNKKRYKDKRKTMKETRKTEPEIEVDNIIRIINLKVL